jgi:hypothetical protein
MRTVAFFLLSFIFAGCSEEDLQISNPPVGLNSGQSSLVLTDKGLVLSWQEEIDDVVKLQMSVFNGKDWSTPNTIASGSNWFINWADFPAIAANNELLFTHFLKMSGETTYDYDIMYSISTDYGTTWSNPRKLHADTISAEHGFVSAIPYKEGFYVSWLDGRNTKIENGAMTLRAAFVARDGSIQNDMEVDHKTCDCCQTAMADVEGTPYLVYRDRSDAEIRDIYYAKFKDKQWQDPVPVHNDNWEINGCPVNGPAIASDGANAAIAWFTGAGGEMNVNLSVSNNGAVSFSDAILVSGPEALGRVDLEMADGTIYLTYMTNEDNTTEIRLSQFNYSGSLLATRVLETISSDRGTGFPRSAFWKNNLIVTWTDVVEQKARIGQYPLATN